MGIFKCMPVKNPDWNGHYKYLHGKDKDNKLYTWNMGVDPYNQDDVVNEFENNYLYLQNNSKHKNVYYHNILSLPSNNMSEKEQEQALYDISSKYVDLMAKDNLILGAIHKSSNMHMHLIQSSNSMMSDKPTRLSKKEFRKVQRDLELYKNSKYPELKTNHYELTHKTKHKQKNKENEINRRGRQTKKQKVLHDFKLILNNSKSKKELYSKVKAKNLRLYRRGKHIGIINLADPKKTKYRLNTLEKNLTEKFVKKYKQLEQQQKIQYQVQERIRQEKLQQKQQMQSKTKGLNYEPKI